MAVAFWFLRVSADVKNDDLVKKKENRGYRKKNEDDKERVSISKL